MNNIRILSKNLTYLSLALALTPSLSLGMAQEQIEHLPGFPAFGDAAYRLFPDEATIAILRENPEHIKKAQEASRVPATLPNKKKNDPDPAYADTPVNLWYGVRRPHPLSVLPSATIGACSKSAQLPEQQEEKATQLKKHENASAIDPWLDVVQDPDMEPEYASDRAEESLPLQPKIKEEEEEIVIIPAQETALVNHAADQIFIDNVINEINRRRGAGFTLSDWSWHDKEPLREAIAYLRAEKRELTIDSVIGQLGLNFQDETSPRYTSFGAHAFPPC